MCIEVDGQKLDDTARLAILRKIEEESKFVPSQFERGSPSEQIERRMELKPNESVALTCGLAQVLRGERPTPNVSAVCVLALARITGKYDWTKEQP